MTITALAGWFGSNRLLAANVGAALRGRTWVGIVFAGGMAEVPHIDARTILVNDRHRHVINLARVVADDSLRPKLIRRLARNAVHPDQLAAAQNWCLGHTGRPGSGPDGAGSWPAPPDLDAAEHYFTCCWMGRAARAGTKTEFSGRLATRWNANGGDSAVRHYSALRSLVPFSRSLRRCTFDTADGFDFIARTEDTDDHGLYCDPPFPEAGRGYLHNAGQTDADEIVWHTRLRDSFLRFNKTRVVCRFYDHALIRTLYPESDWHWYRLSGRKQNNDVGNELLLVNRVSGQPQISDQPCRQTET